MTDSSTNTDLRTGVNGDVGCKYPCMYATTANIDLEGLQTIDGVVGVAGDIVLAKNQTDQAENGVYIMSTGIWQRAVWFNDQLNVAPGTLVTVYAGTQNESSIWETICADNPIQFDTSDITFELRVQGSSTGDKSVELTGDVTGDSSEVTPGILTIPTTIANSAVTTVKIADNNVTNAKLAQVSTATFKGRITAATGNVEDLTVTQATSMLNNFVGDSGSGGTKGLVPAPAAGDAALSKFLAANGGWAVPTSLALAAGAVMSFAMSTPPVGWLECDGTAISRTTYATLFSAIGVTFGSGDGSTTFNIPDVRGYFVRGWDHSRGVDTGRAFGSNQGFSLQNITGSLNVELNASTSMAGAFALADSSGTVSSTTASSTTAKKIASFDASRIATTSTETRPINIALMYCIKT